MGRGIPHKFIVSGSSASWTSRTLPDRRKLASNISRDGKEARESKEALGTEGVSSRGMTRGGPCACKRGAPTSVSLQGRCRAGPVQSCDDEFEGSATGRKATG
jgi:hypothetical protein